MMSNACSNSVQLVRPAHGDHLAHGVHSTPLGEMISRWSDQGLYSLRWSERPLESHSPALDGDDRRFSELDRLLDEYFTTGDTDFGAIEMDGDGWTKFSSQVYRHCRSIASGSTMTYKELACRSGNPAASRAVGAAMSRNRILLVIPCHRVISASGGLRGFSAPGGLRTKQFLLDLEAA